MNTMPNEEQSSWKNTTNKNYNENTTSDMLHNDEMEQEQRHRSAFNSYGLQPLQNSHRRAYNSSVSFASWK